MPPTAVDPGAHDSTGSQPRPAPDGGGERASTDETNSSEGDELGPDAAKMVKDATGF